MMSDIFFFTSKADIQSKQIFESKENYAWQYVWNTVDLASVVWIKRIRSLTGLQWQNDGCSEDGKMRNVGRKDVGQEWK